MVRIKFSASISLVILCNCVHAGLYTTCDLEGLTGMAWLYPIELEPTPDTFRGDLITYKTEHILRIHVLKSNYLDASYDFNSKILRIFPNDEFNDYTKRNSQWSIQSDLSIQLGFDCDEDDYDDLEIISPFIQTTSNNYAPYFSEDKYEFTMATTIPKGFEFTKLVPISAFDYDIPRTKVTFEIEQNDYLKVGLQATTEDNLEYFTTLTAVDEISAPFKQSFVLKATDQGEPPQISEITITVSVVSIEEEGEEETIHPPVFSEHLYFADYTSTHEFSMEDGPIVIKYGSQSNTALKQTGYEQFFKIKFTDDERNNIVVEKIASLSDDILKNQEFALIDIAATNAAQSVPGRTALLIRLPNLYKVDSEESDSTTAPGGTTEGSKSTEKEPEMSSVPPIISTENPDSEHNQNDTEKKCGKVIENGYFSDAFTIPFAMLVLVVFSVVFTNMYAIILFIRKDKDVFTK